MEYNKEQSAIYDKLHFNKDYKFESNFILDMIRNYDSALNSVLDVGCGSGEHLYNLRSAGLRVDGVDPSPSMIELAASKLGSSDGLVCGYINDVSGKYDAIISMFNVVNHLLDEESLSLFFSGVLSKMNRKSILVFDCFNYDAYIKDPPVISERVFSDGSRLDIVPEVDGDSLTMHCVYDSGDVKTRYRIYHKIWKKDYILDLLASLDNISTYKNFSYEQECLTDYKMMIVGKSGL